MLNQSGAKRSSARIDRPDSSWLAADMVRISWLFLLVGIAAGGCAERYELELQQKTLQAQNIAPQNYKPDLLAFMRTYLNNPDNLRNAAISEPQKLEVSGILETERYAACLRYNAKDNTGRYTGLRDHLAVFVSGKFDRLIELGRADAGAGAERLRPLRDYCATAAYQPFPELEKLRR
jgi:hypothetical protein